MRCHLLRLSLLLIAGAGVAGSTGGCLPRVRLDTRQAQAARQHVAGLTQEEVLGWAEQLAEAHRTDPDSVAVAAESHRPELAHLTHRKAGRMIWRAWQAAGLQPYAQCAQVAGHQVKNIVADVPGTRWPNEVVVVMAHYDAFYAGADDNCSGVAALMALARLAQAQPLARTVRFVAVDLEEMGFYGSRAFVQRWPAEQTLTIALVFDALGYYTDAPNSQTGIPGVWAPSTGNFLAILANDDSAEAAGKLAALGENATFLPQFGLRLPGHGMYSWAEAVHRSDHVPFWEKHMPAMLLTDTGDLRYAAYHTDRDSVAHLQPQKLFEAVRLAATAMVYWANESAD